MGKVWLEKSLSQSEGRVDGGGAGSSTETGRRYHNKCDMYIYRQNIAMFISSTIGYTLHWA